MSAKLRKVRFTIALAGGNPAHVRENKSNTRSESDCGCTRGIRSIHLGSDRCGQRVANGVYVSPYQGTITSNSMSYSGFMICDDFNTESYLNAPWLASMTGAGALNGTEKFPWTATFGGSTYSAQQAYNAAGWLGNGLLNNLNDPNTQINYSFAIWDIFDGRQMDPSGGATTLEAAAFSAVNNGYVASNVSVYTPTPLNASQEFLVVSPPTQAPEIDPASAASGLTLLLGGLAVASGGVLRLAGPFGRPCPRPATAS